MTTDGLIDGRDVATDGTKLDGIETAATADQTGAQIKTAYEAESNAYTDAKDTKLSGIATSATANDTDANLKARANHTGTQAAATISDFNTEADARITAAVGVSVQAHDADAAKTDEAQTFTAFQASSVEAMTDGATITPTGTKHFHSVTLAGNRTLAAPSAITAGGTYVFKVTQDATGSRTLAWNAVFDWGASTAPTLTTAANGIDAFSGFSVDGTSIQMTTIGQAFG